MLVYFFSPTFSRLDPLYFNTSICKSNFPLARKEDKRCFFSPLPDFSFYLVMELKPQFWITVKLCYRNDSSVTSEPVFLQRYIPSRFSLCLAADKTCVVALKNGSAMLTQVLHLHCLQFQSSPSVLVSSVSPLYFKLLKTKPNLLYIRIQSVPRNEHFPPRL